MDSALPTVYALRGNKIKKGKRRKENNCPNSTEKCQKIPSHDTSAHRLPVQA
jgi:hypothetical protein